MVFKGRFFSSSKKSDSSSNDGSNSPKTPTQGSSPSRSEKKKIRSSGEDPDAVRSSGRPSLIKDAVHQLQQKKDKDPKGKAAAAKPSPLSAPPKLRKGTEAESGESLAPILASSLGLNRIKTRSGPLPRESSRGDHRISSIGASSLRKIPADSRCSTSTTSSSSSSSAFAAAFATAGRSSGKKKEIRGLEKVPESQAASWADHGEVPAAGRADGQLLRNGESSSLLKGKVTTSWNHSEDLKNSAAFTSEAESPYDYCETPKESESPRFKAIMQATSAPRKRFPSDIKSFSHELNSKGVRPFPFWKPRSIYNLKEVLKVIQLKFEKAKEEVNSDLAIFAGDMIGIMEKNADIHPEWEETLEDLLLLARNCSVMTPGEFWIQCEGIVQHLDDRRQELPMGVLKKLHTRMLFVLTRCTRLLQFHKESVFAEDELIMGHRDSRFTQSADKKDSLVSGRDGKSTYTIERTFDTAAARKSYSQEQHNLKWKRSQEIKPGKLFSPLDVDNAQGVDSPISRERMASWKPLPSPAAKNQKVASPNKDEPCNRKIDAPQNLNRRVSDKEIPTSTLPEIPSSGDSSVQPSVLSKHKHTVSWGHWADQQNISEDGSIMCRICEEYVPTLYVEDHSKICAIADRLTRRS